MKNLLLILFIIPFISFGQTSLFYERPTEIIATKDPANTIGLSINTQFLENITENSLDYLNIMIPFIDGDIEFTLHKFSIVNDQISIVSKTSIKEEQELITPTVLSYKVFYKEKNIGVLNVVNNEIVATFTIDNKQYEISKFNNRYLLFEASNSINASNFSCQVESEYSSMNIESNLSINVCVELAIEIDHYTRQTFNSDLEATNWALAIIAGVSQLYEAQTNASISVITILIWNTTDPYESIVNDASYMLSEIKSYWQTNYNSISRDLVHLLSKRSNTGTGGIAYLNGLCSNNSGYGFSSAMDNDTTYSFPNPTYTWNLMVVTHEVGHNFGANHTHWCGWAADPLYNFSGGGIDDCGVVSGSSNACNPPAPSPPGGIGTIMSYCHNGGSGIALNFHDIVLSQALTPAISSASCLTTCGEGCTDSLAFNYNPNSYIDNGTCCYIAGCTNPIATNYNANACIDDGICLFPPVSFCDDFESYQNGDPIAETSADWETWGSITSPNPPYYDDATVTNTLASSGANSLYFIGVGSGGPQDVVLPFGTGGPYTSGYFNFSANFYITNSAYFNFQAEQIPGITWTSSIFFNNSGSITISNTSASSFSGSYIQGVWFEFKFEIDLTNNIWEVFIDGVSQGSFSNTVNQIASLDLYPTQGDEFYVDDVCFEFSNTPIGQIIGCTDSIACNYDPLADTDDGSCNLPDGCTDATACNYDATATCDDGSCAGLLGCMDATACNYDQAATCDDGSCLTAYGCMDATACNYDASATCDDGSCLTAYGCMDATACNYDQAATCDDGSCLTAYGCTDSTACNYDATATCDDGSCAYSTLSYETRTECDSYLWNGNTYSSSGIFTYQASNSVGCDSTATLDLTINNSSASTDTQVHCDSYTWSVNGVTYTTSGVYTYLTTNSNGCDSTASLNLTINPSTTSSVSVTECDSYSWNGQAYTTIGVYTYLTTNSNGCDSTATLNLIFSEPTAIIIANGTQLNVSANGGTQPYIYELFGPNGLLLTSNNNNGTFVIFNPPLNGEYYFIATDALGCVTDTAFFTVDFASAIDEISSIKKLVNITDILGRVISFEKNLLLFYRYDDGTVEKKIIIE